VKNRVEREQNLSFLLDYYF